MTSRQKLYLLIFIILAPLVLGLILFLTQGTLTASEASLAELVEFYRSLGFWAVFISLALNVVQTFFVIMPSVFLSGANAVVFGIFWGTVISWLGELIGATVAFIVYRYLGRGYVEKVKGRKEYLLKIDELSSNRGFFIVLGLRVLPAFPSGIVNLLGALSKISFVSFLAATALGKLPSIVLETYVGHDLLTWQENLPRLLILLTLAIVAYVVIKKIHNYNKKQ